MRPILEVDFGYLKFELGHEGADAIDKLRGLANHPKRVELEAAMAQLDHFGNRYEWLLEKQQTALSLKSAQPLPAGLAESIRASANELACAGGECFVFPLESTPGGPAAFGVLVSRVPNWIPVFAREADGTWRRSGVFTTSDGVDVARLRSAVDAGDYAAVAPVTPDLRVGEQRFRFVPGFTATASLQALGPVPPPIAPPPHPVDRNTGPAPQP